MALDQKQLLERIDSPNNTIRFRQIKASTGRAPFDHVVLTLEDGERVIPVCRECSQPATAYLFRPDGGYSFACVRHASAGDVASMW